MTQERTVADVRGRLVLDSHLAWTPEFDIVLDDGGTGRGSAPRGETTSIFETTGAQPVDEMVAAARAALVGHELDQAALDETIERWVPTWGAQATLALSIACYLAPRSRRGDVGEERVPRLLLNVLNGGMHAYTNPVEADVHELMIYARSTDLRSTADAYRRLLDGIHDELARYPLTSVGGNEVHRIGDPPTEAAFGLLRTILDREGLSSEFQIAVDASAGDWWTGDAYELPVSGSRFTTDQLVEWWLSLIEAYGIELLEDPLAEEDRAGWSRLRAERPDACAILGDNYTSTSLDQLVGGGKAPDLDGVLVKPNQNGTVSGSLAFARAAKDAGLSVIASHRSVETESTFLAELAREMGADGLKIGPFRDFTAVVKFNELLRLEEGARWSER